MNELTICMLFKWCEHRYLMEWIDHHAKLGADRFILVCDDDDLHYVREILKFFSHLDIELRPSTDYPNQTQAGIYQWAMDTNQDSKLVCCLDDDEFVIVEEGYDFKEWLSRVHESHVPWLIDRVDFGNTFYEVNPPSQLGHLIYRTNKMSHFPKWICDPRQVREHPLHFPPGEVCDAMGVRYDHAEDRQPDTSDWLREEDKWLQAPVRINHYTVRSIADFHHLIMKDTGRLVGKYPSWELVTLRRGIPLQYHFIEDKSATRYYDVERHCEFLRHLGTVVQPKPHPVVSDNWNRIVSQ